MANGKIYLITPLGNTIPVRLTVLGGKQVSVKKYGKIYNTWTDIKRRVRKQNTYIYEEWMNFHSFHNWAKKNGYVEGESALVRKEEDLGFVPDNCMFIKKYTHGVKHGMYNTSLYEIWSNMKQRCNNPKNGEFHNYGGRGIKVDDEWLDSFETFMSWAMSNGYVERLSLERIDVNGNYEPSNCCWIEWVEQHQNKRQTIWIEYQGKRQSLTKWGRELGLPKSMLLSRYTREGIRDPELLFAPKKLEPPKPFFITIDGTTLGLSDWERKSGVSRKTIKKRYDEGKRGSDLIAPVPKELKPKGPTYIEIDGDVKTTSEWSRISGLGSKTILYRLHNGVTGRDLLAPPDHARKWNKV